MLFPLLGLDGAPYIWRKKRKGIYRREDEDARSSLRSVVSSLLAPFFLFSVSFGREAGLLINGCPPPVQHFLCDWLFLRQPLWLSLCVACHEQTPSALFLSIPLAAPEWRAQRIPPIQPTYYANGHPIPASRRRCLTRVLSLTNYFMVINNYSRTAMAVASALSDPPVREAAATARGPVDQTHRAEGSGSIP